MYGKYFQNCVNVTEGYTTSQQCSDVTRLQCSIKQQVRGVKHYYNCQALSPNP